jgi:phage tail sheath gpL-like
MATLAFKYFPAQTWRPSGVYAEFDPSMANTAIQNLRALVIGQMLSSGTATPNVPFLAYSQAQVNAACGVNSMAALMYQAYRLQDAYGECWVGPLSDNASGIAQTQTILPVGTATGAGTLALYVGGISVPVAVNQGDTPTVMGTNIAAAINAIGCPIVGAPGTQLTANSAGIPVSAVSASGTVTLTLAHKGVGVADIDMRVNYLGVPNNEAFPPGVTGITFATVTPGSLNPVLTTLLANCGEQPYDFVVNPYTDAASLLAISNFLSDQVGRWSAIEMLYGHSFSAYRGTAGARATFGNTQNNQHQTILGWYDSPTSTWISAADFAGAHAVRIRVNPAQGVADQVLNTLAPPVASRDTPATRNVMLYDGMSTMFVDAAGVSHIDRSITTYQLNAAGQPDNSYLNTNLLFQAAYAARYIKAQLTSQFIVPGKILVVDGTLIPPGAPATTPSLIFQAVVGMYAYLASVFVVQDVATFSKQGYASTGTKGQVLLFLPFNFSDQVIQIAALIQFQQTT